MSSLLVLIATLPLMTALACLLHPRGGDQLSLVASMIQLVASVLLVTELPSRSSLSHALGGWAPGLGIALGADPLAGWLVLLCALVQFATTLYARFYFCDSQARYRLWPLWWLLASALYALLLSGDLFNLYVTLELLGLSAAALCTVGAAKAEALEAALRYLLLGLIGSLLYLAGVALVYAEYGTLDVSALRTLISSSPASLASLVLLSSGLMIKCALVPLHFWLPAAHSSAPAPVSAVLSALVVKVAFYLLLRLWFELFTPVVTSAFATLIGLLGAIAVIWGSWQAFRATRLKLLAAYSTLSQMGYLFMFVPIVMALPEGDTRQFAYGALLLLAVSHGIAKAALFMGIGSLQQHLGHDEIDRLGGSARKLPVTLFAISLAGVALVGLPPSGAFLAKWALISSSLVSGQWWWMLVTLVGTLLAAAYLVRVLGAAFAPTAAAEPALPTCRLALQQPALLLAVLATFGLGFAASPVWDTLSLSPPEVQR
ncbi:complex I subunit 5 family protein [Motiliproteus sp. SC1-56]|uniref:complex I subunit 5 family protein n=1 Tax=Motiliproteus sp. SC1-56 TaxID=2799565 RepID=UPI001A8FB6F1|nr:proton-conducting transporter membrane subunit [Motiliproteus sp. SC1-56]